MNCESEVEEGGRAAEERERFVFMLVVTEVFIAPPTPGERERETGERGCREEGDKRGIQKKGEREAERQIRGTAGGEILLKECSLKQTTALLEMLKRDGQVD